MKILLITSEEWNDYVMANGVLTNWFTDFDVELAQVYGSPGLPINSICDRYFQISDGQMARSIIGGGKAGGVISKPVHIEEKYKTDVQLRGIYGFMKTISLTFRTPVLMIRDFLWMHGKINEDALRKFIEDFNPDVVFCPRYVDIKMMRLERAVSNMTKAPFIAYTGDDDVYVGPFRPSPKWYRRWRIQRMFKKHVNIFSHYMMHSADQAKEYRDKYGINTSVIFKCGEFPDSFVPKSIGSPIRLVYAGRLYCNRWKSLAEIGKALQTINQDSVKMVLDIYTQEALTKNQECALSEDKYIYVKGSVTPAELKEIYKNADIALHVESLDEYYRVLTRVSFSTKIIDLMASSCAILAICWERHCGYQYLKENDAAFCCPNYESILPQLQKICNNPEVITEYQQKAYDCGKCNHNRQKIQKQLLDVFNDAIKNNQEN